MQSPAGRVLALLSLLQSRPLWNATELAERLGVTTRTVRRDVTRLRDLGYPVLADTGPTGGYQLGPGGALPPLLLSDDEAVAVAIGLRVATTGSIAGFETAAVAALAKLEQVLPVHLREHVAALTTSTLLLGPEGGPIVDPVALLTLAQACRRLERLKFEYRDGSGNESERRVEPYRLVNAHRRWYLVAHDLDRDGWRTFRVDRLRHPALTGHRFVRDAEPDAAAMVADALAVLPYQWQAEVRLPVEPAVARESIAPTVGAVEPDEGAGSRLRIGANELDWIARYLASLPFEVEVVDPPELRAALRQLGRRLLRHRR